jgi:hypothetical protein
MGYHTMDCASTGEEHSIFEFPPSAVWKNCDKMNMNIWFVAVSEISFPCCKQGRTTSLAAIHHTAHNHDAIALSGKENPIAKPLIWTEDCVTPEIENRGFRSCE